MVAVACIRSSNRYYHLPHPELHLEMSTPVLVVWTTIVAGVTAAGWHFLGWAFLLLGWAGWSTRSLPRMLSVLLVVWGIASLFEYRLPDIEMSLVMLGVVVSTWQGIVLWKTRPGEAQPPGNIAKRESCSRDNR
jgi:hypothetical protein